jgi:protein-disulfide isomerase/uncharacterized membrane protein
MVKLHKTPWKFIAFLSLIGSVLSGYALHSYYATQAGMGAELLCNIGERLNCSAVSQSAWATLYGIPVAALGLGFYCALTFFSFIVSFTLPASIETELSKILRNMLLTLMLLTFLFSCFLFGISLFSIKALCLVCLGMDFVHLLLLLSLWRAGQEDSSLLRRFDQGYHFLLRVPLRAAGIGADVPKGIQHYSLFFFIAFLLSFGVSISFGERIFRAGSPEEIALIVEKASESARVQWLSEPLTDLPSISSSGVDQDYVRGPDDAPVKIFEIFDYECGYCRMLARDIHELIEKYPGAIQLQVRNFPLDPSCNDKIPAPGHQSACMVAEYVRCAGEQGKFWELYDDAFALSELDAGVKKAEVEKALRLAAQGRGLDDEAMKECLRSDRQLKSIQRDIELGRKLAIAGTPAVWINNRRVERPNQSTIEGILKSILSQS